MGVGEKPTDGSKHRREREREREEQRQPFFGGKKPTDGSKGRDRTDSIRARFRGSERRTSLPRG